MPPIVYTLAVTIIMMHKTYQILLILFIPLVFQTLIADSSKPKDLDAYFGELKTAPNQEIASIIENQIWSLWFQSGNEDIDTVMKGAMKQKGVYDFNGAIELINKAIDLKPDYSEAWNQRATIHFHQQKYELALEDIATTLELEPRHFGALAGRAVIRLHQNKPALARQNIIEALKINPYLKERSFFPDLNNN